MRGRGKKEEEKEKRKKGKRQPNDAREMSFPIALTQSKKQPAVVAQSLGRPPIPLILPKCEVFRALFVFQRNGSWESSPR